MSFKKIILKVLILGMTAMMLIGCAEPASEESSGSKDNTNTVISPVAGKWEIIDIENQPAGGSDVTGNLYLFQNDLNGQGPSLDYFTYTVNTENNSIDISGLTYVYGLYNGVWFYEINQDGELILTQDVAVSPVIVTFQLFVE